MGLTGGENRSYVLNIGGWSWGGPGGTDPGRVCFHLTPDGYSEDYYLPSTQIVPVDTWTHVVATYDGLNMSLYINDVLDTTSGYYGFVAVAAGASQHSLGLKSDGTIVAWGRNDYGECNVPTPNAYIWPGGTGAMRPGARHRPACTSCACVAPRESRAL